MLRKFALPAKTIPAALMAKCIPGTRLAKTIPCTLTLLAMLLCIAVLPCVADDNNPMSIADFVGCINKKVANKGNVSTANVAKECLPKGCNIHVTMSQESAQKACNLGGCQLPRVIFDCEGPAAPRGVEGPLRFRPSFLLCPADSKGAGDLFGLDRIELGEDTTKVEGNTGNMKMGDVPIPPNKVLDPLQTDKVTSSKGNSKGCISCHGSGVPAAVNNGDPLISKPFDTFNGKRGRSLKPFIIDSRDPDPNKQAITRADPNVKVGGQVVMPESLKDVCDCIAKNKKAIADDAKDPAAMARNGFEATDVNPTLNPDLLLSLCRGLQDNREKRACGELKQNGVQLACSNVQGGGKFLMPGNAVSTLVFDLSGEALPSMSGLNTTYSFTSNMEGYVSAFNYQTQTMIDAVQLTTLSVNSSPSGDLQIIGTGTGLVNGSLRNLIFNAGLVSGVLSYSIEDSNTLEVLASGTGESGRSAAGFNVLGP